MNLTSSFESPLSSGHTTPPSTPRLPVCRRLFQTPEKVESTTSSYFDTTSYLKGPQHELTLIKTHQLYSLLESLPDQKLNEDQLNLLRDAIKPLSQIPVSNLWHTIHKISVCLSQFLAKKGFIPVTAFFTALMLPAALKGFLVGGVVVGVGHLFFKSLASYAQSKDKQVRKMTAIAAFNKWLHTQNDIFLQRLVPTLKPLSSFKKEEVLSFIENASDCLDKFQLETTVIDADTIEHEELQTKIQQWSCRFKTYQYNLENCQKISGLMELL